MQRGTPAGPGEALGVEVGRLADRLRSTSDVRLRQPLTPETSRAAAALELAQLLADAAQGIEGRHSPLAPSWRVVPDLGVFALGDQVAVTGADVVHAVTALPAGEPVWTPAGRRPVGEVVADLADAVRALRLAL